MNNQVMDEKVSALKAVLIKVLWAVGLVVLVVGSYQGYKSHKSKKNAEAAVLFHKLEQIEQSTQESDPQSPEEANAALVFEPSKLLLLGEDKVGEYKGYLEQIDKSYSGTKIWALSQIRWGMLLEKQAEFGEAESKYRTVLDSGVDSPLYRGMAANALGVLLENQDKIEEALSVYEQAAKDDLNPLRAVLLFGQARSLNALGKEGSDKIYDEIISKFPESNYSRKAKVLKSLKVQAR